MSRSWLIATRLLLLVALATSAILYSYYLDPVDSEFCAVQSGCETLRRTPLAYFFGNRYLSLPLFGMLGFAAAFVLSLWTERRASPERHAPLCWALAAAAASAVGLVAYQAWVAHAFCYLCLIVDASTVFAALSAFTLHYFSIAGDPQRPGLFPWAWCALAALAAGAPLIWHGVRPLPPVPGPIRALYQPGKINVVEFADFGCPHCRKLHPMLKGVIESYPGKVNFVRKHAPLPQHPYADLAASAVICADNTEQGERMADRLMAVELSKEAIDDIARELGLELQAFQLCLQAPTTLARIEQDMALLTGLGFEGLPTTYVGGQRFIGARSEEAWRDAFERAERGEGNTGIPGPVFLALLAVLGGGLVWKGRKPASETGVIANPGQK